MPSPQEIRKIRLGNDYKQMQRIQGSIISWHPLKGTVPYIEEYEITINVRTIEGIGTNGKPKYRNSSKVILTLPADYPRVAPKVVMQTRPKPFHPNWFPGMNWCYGTWFPSEALGDYVIRMVKTLQFDKDITNENSPADVEANEWYKRNINSGLFPCDRQVLPDPSSSFKFPQQSGFRVIRRS